MRSYNEITQLRVNGQPHSVNIGVDLPKKTTLLSYLRDHLGLTGVKDGCSQRGECGACTVIVNGKAQKSCLLPLEGLHGASVETVEGLADGQNLHPLQWAFAEEGAVECGFCTPGAILTARALLDRNSKPTKQETIKALSGNLCRCGTYQQMVKAIQKASHALANKHAYRPIKRPTRAGGDFVGIPYPRIDAEEKVTGKAIFGQDLKFEGMVYAAPVMTLYAHADILDMDTKPASDAPGVIKVLTPEDLPGSHFRGVITPDWPVFAENRALFIGEVLALVIAKSLTKAQAAARKVRVTYNPLPVLSDPEQALTERAPQIHPEGNLCSSEHILRGDVDKGMRKARVVIDRTYVTQSIEHAYLGVEAGVATFSEKDGVTIYMGGHDSETNRMEVARCLDLAEHKVRIICPHVGGSFGAKRDISIQVFLALGALRTGRPVKMVLTRSESMRMSTKRHPMKMHFVTGFSKKGKITASTMEIICDAGAYSSETAPVLRLAVGHCTGPYYIPNLDIRGQSVYTNNVIGGAMRGYGFSQTNFAMESQLDIAARKLGLDPIKIRRINAIRKGGITSYGQRVDTEVSLIRCLELAQKRARESAPKSGDGWQVGIGLAGCFKTTAISHGRDPGAEASIEISPEGIVIVKVNCHEFGQGTATGLVQIVAQTLGLTPDRIQVVKGDTSLPKGGPAIASRQTFVLGMAVLKAARALKQRILNLCEETATTDKSGLSIASPGAVSFEKGSESIPWDEIPKIANHRGVRLEASFRHELPPASPIPEKEGGSDNLRFDQSLAYGAHAAVVRVEKSTGKIIVDRLIAVHDVGKIINPLSCQSQIVGAALMGLGQATSENLNLRDGKIMNDSLRSYGIPTIDLVNTIEAIAIENPDPLGPFGAKGLSEAPIVPVAAAVANAIYDAVGIRLNRLPLRIDGIPKLRT